MSAKNGTHQPGLDRQSLRKLRDEAKHIEASLQVQYLRGIQKQLNESAYDRSSSWAIWATDRLKSWQTQPDKFVASGRTDRLRGRNSPIYANESELAIHRGLSRIMCATNNFAIGLLEGLTSYVIGSGFTYRVASVDEEQKAPKALIKFVQGVVDALLKLNSWRGGELPNMEEELFKRSVEDGEFITTSFVDREGWTQWRTVEPEHVTQPAGGDYATPEWFLGCHNVPGDVQTIDAYYIQHGENITDGKVWTADKVTHLRRNVKRSMKRGYPDFSFDTYDSLENATKLRRAIALGAALQASIAGIRQHQSATQANVTSFVSALEDWSKTNPVTGRAESTFRAEPGRYIDIPEGLEYKAPPGYANANDFVSVLHTVLEGAGQRWNAPTWLTTGSMGDSNYASALVGESPFVRRVEREQRTYGEVFGQKMIWNAVCERLKHLGTVQVVNREGDNVQQLSFTYEEIKKLVCLQVEGSSVKVRNEAEEASRDQTYVQLGVKSRQTVAQEQGLDWDQERANMAEWQDEFGQQMPQLPGLDALGGQQDTPEMPKAPTDPTPDVPRDGTFTESLRECDEGPNKGKPGPCPSGGGETGSSGGASEGELKQMGSRLKKLSTETLRGVFVEVGGDPKATRAEIISGLVDEERVRRGAVDEAIGDFQKKLHEQPKEQSKDPLSAVGKANRDAIAAAKTTGDKVSAAAEVDRAILDETYQKAGLPTNEAMRFLDAKYREFVGSKDMPKERIKAGLDRAESRIKMAADGLARIGRDAESAFYADFGLPLVAQVRRELLTESLRESVGVCRASLKECTVRECECDDCRAIREGWLDKLFAAADLMVQRLGGKWFVLQNGGVTSQPFETEEEARRAAEVMAKREGLKVV